MKVKELIPILAPSLILAVLGSAYLLLNLWLKLPPDNLAEQVTESVIKGMTGFSVDLSPEMGVDEECRALKILEGLD